MLFFRSRVEFRVGFEFIFKLDLVVCGRFYKFLVKVVGVGWGFDLIIGMVKGFWKVLELVVKVVYLGRDFRWYRLIIDF